MTTNSVMIDRRRTLKGIAASGAGLAVAARTQVARAAQATPVSQATPVTQIDDDTIFNFVLNLEYLEAEYYLLGTTGTGVGAEDLGANPGTVTGGSQVPFQTDAFRQFAEELAGNELAHVRYYREELGAKAVDRPTLDFTAGFAAVAQGAGLGADFDPFSGEISFFLGGMLFEDVGVTGYKGATPLIKDKERLEDIAGVLGVEAYHMGMARSHLFEAGQAAISAANAITVARGKLNGKPEIEQGIEVNGHANFVPSDDNGVAFSRTPQEVLQIAYVTPNTGVSSGGFFPDGFNGELKTT